MISKIPCLSINARHHLQVYSIRCSGLQNGCQLHYNTADSVLTSGCSFISQHIWIKICIVLAILGRCIKSEPFSSGMRCMWIHISGRQIDGLGTMSSGMVTIWGRWRFGQRWRRLWSRLSALVGWKCAWSFVSQSCLRILCSAIWARKASGRVVLTKHSRVSFQSQQSPFHAQEAKHPASSLDGYRRKVSWSGIVFPLLWLTKTLHWPFSQYSRPGACRTVPAVPDLLALPY